MGQRAGDIGRGINKLAGDIDQLLASRIEDERRKQDLEYRMLQNEVNPHFIYNTLNSIRWMATIQNAPGIAEMVTAFARLTKSISKSTEKLVPLQQELALLNDYFIIQQYRYGGDIEIEVSNIEDESLCQDCMIPGLPCSLWRRMPSSTASSRRAAMAACFYPSAPTRIREMCC